MASPGLRFLEHGDFGNAWGKGTWGFIDKGKGQLDNVSVFAEFAGVKHLLTFENIGENNALHDTSSFPNVVRTASSHRRVVANLRKCVMKKKSHKRVSTYVCTQK